MSGVQANPSCTEVGEEHHWKWARPLAEPMPCSVGTCSQCGRVTVELREPVVVPEWERICDALWTALSSFTAYDGRGQGGAEDGNRGDWSLAADAEGEYFVAKGIGGRL